ncbi:long-chain fatty acid transport protein 4 isoform X2 [Bacillus rossius redtenbacheri]|uniref:long-chain fatty acid transport protein 4 isoform X2 n=1 Tax=Bacillus rossius redtenbacheri TaxID=93214 RepID=UPI002FDF07FF
MCNGNEAVPSEVKGQAAEGGLGGAEAGEGGMATCHPGGRRCAAAARKVLRRLTVAMLLAALVGGLGALVWHFMGWMFLLQLVLVALVAYVAASGSYRWFYVALRTLPRDATALSKYAALLWQVRSYEKKDLTIADIFRQRVARHPNKACFIFEDAEWTFSQVEEYSNKAANVFKSQGYRKGDVVALMLESRPEFVCLWLGLSKLGVVVPLINHNLRLRPLLHSVSVAHARALIFGADLAEAVKDVTPSLPAGLALYRWSAGPGPADEAGSLGQDLAALLHEAPAAPPVVDEKVGYHDRLMYIYTSGTTGLPKAAVITNARCCFMALGITHMQRLRHSDVVYVPLPLYHSAGGILGSGQAFVSGLTVVIRGRFSASGYFPDCIRYRCTVAQYIGEMCRYILAVPPRPEDRQHRLRMVFGNGLRPEIWSKFVQRFNIPRVGEFYGATEGNANITNVDNKVGAIGFISRIFPSVYPISIIRVDPDSGEPIRNEKGLCTVCKPGEPGVFVGKIQPNNPSRAFLGYVDEKESQKKVVYDVFNKGDSAFISGDILVSDELGYLYFKDRTGDTFRWKGENVSTSEVEAVVSGLVEYRDTVVYGVQVGGLEGRAGMAAILDHNDSLDLRSLAEGVKRSLPGYARPLFLRALHKVDMTGTYKLKKKDLQEEGFNPAVIKDKLYYMSAAGQYEPLSEDVYRDIESGRLRL